jgi:transcriptional regulator with XRE-family HTH domain
MNSTRNEKVLKKFGKNLQRIRTEKNLSLRKLADIADVDFSQIHRIEKGESNPTLTMLLTLSEALNISINDLLEF